jgi:hypothetical protein
MILAAQIVLLDVMAEQMWADTGKWNGVLRVSRALS